jgi:hypothetical protein
MKRNRRFSLFIAFFSIYYVLGLSFFYYKYVPIINSFQIILIPILFLTLVLTSVNLRSGILFFVFIFPLINNLPYFFGIDENIPHAPTALVLFLVFFLGWLFNIIVSSSKGKLNHPIFEPLMLFSLIVFVSGVVTFFRFANFFPFLSDNVYDLVVNVNGVRAGGALMSDVFTFLSYITVFLFLFILFNAIHTREFVKKILIVLSISIFLSLMFSLIQIYYSMSLGNTAIWVWLKRINSTFKDPNSFGAILSCFLPLVLGMGLAFRKNSKLFFLFLLIFGLIVFPAIGSRSAFLGLGVSFITFSLLFLMPHKISPKKTNIYISSIILIAVFLLFSFLFFNKHSNLHQRIDRSLEALTSKDSLPELFTRKLDLWAIALHMIKDYPLAGIGLGSYIVEMPNWGQTMRVSLGQYTDSAENYLLHIGSELGMIGLFLTFWVFFEIIKASRKAWKALPADNRDKYIVIGSISGIVSLFMNTLFHSYIGSFEVKYFLCVLIAIVLFFSADKAKSKEDKNFSRGCKILAIALSIFLGATQLWNSTHSLSIENRTEKFKWDQNFGLYALEKDNQGFMFQWTRKTAGITEENIGPIMNIPIMASHPDIHEKPVTVKVYSADRNFRKKGLLKELILKESKWINFEYHISELSIDKIRLIFEADRAWQPLKDLGTPDLRWIGVGLGTIYFEYPKEVPENKVENIKKLSYKGWKGKSNGNLYVNGVSKINFEADRENTVLCLYVRGQKAFNIGPYLIVRIDDQIIGKTMLSEDGWTSIVFAPRIGKGVHELSVEYINDFYLRKKGQDRNVFLGDIEIIYLKQGFSLKSASGSN